MLLIVALFDAFWFNYVILLLRIKSERTKVSVLMSSSLMLLTGSMKSRHLCGGIRMNGLIQTRLPTRQVYSTRLYLINEESCFQIGQSGTKWEHHGSMETRLERRQIQMEVEAVGSRNRNRLRVKSTKDDKKWRPHFDVSLSETSFSRETPILLFNNNEITVIYSQIILYNRLLALVAFTIDFLHVLSRFAITIDGSSVTTLEIDRNPIANRSVSGDDLINRN